MTFTPPPPPPPPAPTAPPSSHRGSRAGGITLIIVGAFVVLISLGLLAGGSALMWADRSQRDAAGYLSSSTTSLTTPTYAIAATDLSVAADAPGWHVSSDALGTVRLTANASTTPIFIGVASAADAARFLTGVAYDQITGYAVPSGGPTYQLHSGAAPATPASQPFWQARASGLGTQTVTWSVSGGPWSIVVMNADASRNVAVDVSVGATAPFLFALALGLLIGGAVILAIAVLMLVGGAVLLRRASPPAPSTPAGWTVPAGAAPAAAVPGTARYPLRIEGRLDSPNRWLWLVKWFLLIPHYIVLALLSVAAIVLTVVAFFAILFTGRYPRAIFDFNVGVMRWWWRVGFYAYSALGTDRYPPFTLGPAVDYPATLEVAYPQKLSRGLVLVKWWLLAIPHYLVVSLLVGGTAYAVHDATTYAAPYTGLITLLTFFAAVAVLVTRRYPRGLFDLVVGLNRWVYRVAVYTLLLRDEYPPFRLDLGGEEPTGPAGAPALSPPPAPSGPFAAPRPLGA